MVMDTGTEHEIRQRLAWQRASEVVEFLNSARRPAITIASGWLSTSSIGASSRLEIAPTPHPSLGRKDRCARRKIMHNLNKPSRRSTTRNTSVPRLTRSAVAAPYPYRVFGA
jgi:hypothetical protein